MSLPPWFVKVKFWDNGLYNWIKDIPGYRWDKKEKVHVVPTEVIPLLQGEAEKRKHPIKVM